MKNKNIFLLSIVFLFIMLLSGCFEEKVKYINILTDDASLFEVIDSFNIRSEKIKVKADYINFKNNTDPEKNIFKYFEENKFSSYDLIIGEHNPELSVNYGLFHSLSGVTKKLSAADRGFYHFVVDYVEMYDWKIIPYNVNFYVIAARKDILTKNYINSDDITLDDFFKLIKKSSRKENDSQYSGINLAFIPSVSRIKELDFYYLFYDNLFTKKNEKIILDSQKIKYVFNAYNSFDEVYNFGSDTVKKYLERYNNTNKDFYLKQKIISFDLLPVSEALLLPEETYKIFLIKDMKSLALSSKAAAIPEASIKKNESMSFLDYLYSAKVQKNVSIAVSANPDYYRSFYMPVLKNIIPIQNAGGLSSGKVEKYIDSLKYPEFYNYKFQKKFINKFLRLKDSYSKGQLSDKDFMEKLSSDLK